MIKLENISIKLDNFRTKFTVEINKGEWVGIIGQSGAGKSTFLNLIAGFAQPEVGSLLINNTEMRNLSASKRSISSLFQDNNLFPHLSVYQNIAIAIKPNLKLHENEKGKIFEIIEYLNLSSKIHSSIGTLSGGERQRVALGRVMSSDKKILLLDEPFSQLDPNLRIEMLELIKKIREKKKITIIMAIHTPAEAIDFVSRFLLIKEGEVFRELEPQDYRIDLY
ncbi:MAG: ATP-binding cassette domain-containing protein [Pseudomonadota bacterium]|nr:ATP-binding cassette domain-containing protein [Pseudomonadota bacterium]|tara:strand:- start:1664 stop:2332 length:669 start_codon:yes stop_codon:yes gene_type:complete